MFFKALLDREEIDLILTRDENNSVIITKKGAIGRITQNGKKFKYEFEGNDPINLGIEGSFDYKSSFEATKKSEYPDFLLQATQIFESDRTGDIIVIAKDNCDFRESYFQVKRLWHSYEWPQHRGGGHGGISKSQFRTPIAINYDIDKNYLRSLDLFPTILQLLGIKNGSSDIAKSCV